MDLLFFVAVLCALAALVLPKLFTLFGRRR
jgi:hypothetical protein